MLVLNASVNKLLCFFKDFLYPITVHSAATADVVGPKLIPAVRFLGDLQKKKQLVPETG